MGYTSILLLLSSSYFGFELFYLFFNKILDVLTIIGIGSASGIIISSWIFFITSANIPLDYKHGITHIIALFSSGLLLRLIFRVKLKKSNFDLRILLLSVALPFLILAFFIEKSLLYKSIFTRGACYGDLPFHLNLISSFQHGCNMKRNSLFDLLTPFYANEKLAYTFIPDFFSAVLMSCFQENYHFSLTLPSFFYAFAILIILHNICYKFSKDEKTCILAPWLFLLTGGLGFTQYQKYKHEFYIDFVNNWGDGRTEGWFQTVIHILLPQRCSLFSMPIAYAIILVLMCVGRKIQPRIREFLGVGLLVALLPQVQMHSIIAVAEWGIFYVIRSFPYQVIFKCFKKQSSKEIPAELDKSDTQKTTKKIENSSKNNKAKKNEGKPDHKSTGNSSNTTNEKVIHKDDKNKTDQVTQSKPQKQTKIKLDDYSLFDVIRSYFINYCSLAIVAIFLGFIQIIPFFGRLDNSFMTIKPLWEPSYDRNFFTFWFYALGVFFLLSIFGRFIFLKALSPKQGQYYDASLGVFLISNFIWYQPWNLDNTKVFYAGWIPLAVSLISHFLIKLWKRIKVIGPLIAIVLFILCNLSGYLSLYLAANRSYPLWNNAVVLETTRFALLHTDPKSVWITDSSHLNPIVCLAGRQTLVGYGGWISSHGLDDHRRHYIIQLLQKNPEDTYLIDQLNVSYFYVSQDTRKSFNFEPPDDSKHWTKIYERNGDVIYQRTNYK